MTKICIAVNRASDGARNVAEQLGILRVRTDRIPVVGKRYGTVVNWGCTDNINHPRVINKPESVKLAKDKLLAFMKFNFSGVNHPRATVSKDYAQHEFGFPVLARSRRGSSGRGIVVVREGETIPDAEMYVEYIPKQKEFRLHVFNGQVIFIQQKRKRSGVTFDKDEKIIRSHGNGWVFCENEVDNPGDEAIGQAIRAVAALGLNFGACDVIIGRDDGKPYVLEVNTGPGIESTRLRKAYADAISKVQV